MNDHGKSDGPILPVEIIRTEGFTGIFQTWSIPAMIERLASPNWREEIVFVVIDGSLYFADLELFEAAYTLDQLVLKEGKTRPFSERPKLGGQFLPQNMPEELRGDLRPSAQARPGAAMKKEGIG